MKGYRVYLTKSREVAELLTEACSDQIGKDGATCLSCGMLYDDDRIPAVYHGTGYWRVVIEYDHPVYEIIFA